MNANVDASIPVSPELVFYLISESSLAYVIPNLDRGSVPILWLTVTRWQLLGVSYETAL